MKKRFGFMNQKTKDSILRGLAIFGNPTVWLRKKPKVFVIGTHKTGTTSLKIFLRDLGFRVSIERQFLMLAADYHAGNWDEIFRVIKNYEVFQDEPFNQASDAFIAEIQKRYPDARFILSTRDNATEWFHSLLRFSRKKWAGEKTPIRWDDVKNVEYGKKDDYFRRYLRYHRIDTLDEEAYDKLPFDQDVLENWYNTYNTRITSLLSGNPNFIQVNLKDKDTAERLKQFLGVPHSNALMKRENATKTD
jgi:hypothetical protein